MATPVLETDCQSASVGADITAGSRSRDCEPAVMAAPTSIHVLVHVNIQTLNKGPLYPHIDGQGRENHAEYSVTD